MYVFLNHTFHIEYSDRGWKSRNIMISITMRILTVRDLVKVVLQSNGLRIECVRTIAVKMKMADDIPAKWNILCKV